MTKLSKFTLVGAYDEQEPIFVVAFGSSAQQVLDVWKAMYPQSTMLLLDGHCTATDGQSPNRLDEMVRIVCNYPEDKRSTNATLNAYADFFAVSKLTAPELAV